MSTTESIQATSAGMGAIGSIGSAYSQSKAYEMQGKYQQQVGEINARFADAQAKDALKRGDEEVKQHQQKVKAFIGSQRAALGAQGIEVNDGSALIVQEDAAQLGKLDEITIKSNAWREAFGYKVGASDSRSKGAFSGLLAEYQSRSSLITGGLQAAAYGAKAASYGLGDGDSKGKKG